MPNIKIPGMIPRIDPLPPVNKVPPTTTDAIANNSHPKPSVGCPAPNCDARITPANPDKLPEII